MKKINSSTNRKLTGLFALILAFAMLISIQSVSASASAAENIPIAATSRLPEDSMLLAAVQENLDAYSEHYILHSVSVASKNINELGIDSFDVDFIVELNAELKYNSATQLPHVQGMAARLGIDSSKLTTAEFASKLDGKDVSTALKEIVNESSLATGSAMNSSSMLVVDNSDLVSKIAVNEIKSFVTDIERLYIGQTSTFNLIFRATIDMNGNLISVACVADDGSTYDAQLLKPESVLEMRENGAEQLEELTSIAANKAINDSMYGMRAVATTAVYHRVTARDYANTWTSNPTGGATKDVTKWRTANNPNATAPLYPANTNDCANYVSQAIFAGGIPKTSTEVSDAYHWFASQWGCSAAWENCTHMHTFFTYNNYWTASNITNCNAGGVIFLKDSSGDRYHVVMCVLNDTVNRAYSAHTSDKKAVAYTTSSTFGASSLEFFVFTNSAAD